MVRAPSLRAHASKTIAAVVSTRTALFWSDLREAWDGQAT